MGTPGNDAARSLQLDPRLHRRAFEHGALLCGGIHALEQALCQDELLPVDVVRQSRPLVPALIAVHLRPAKGRAFAAGAAKPQIEVHAGHHDLIRRCRRVAADQDAHRVHA